MKTKQLLATLALSTVLLTGCTLFKNDVILKVNGKPITQAQYDKAFDKAMNASMFSKMGIDVKKDKNGFLYLMIKDKVVNELIVRELMDQELAKRHIEVTKDDVDKEYKSIIEKIGSKSRFDELLKQNNISSSQFKKDLNEEVKIKKLIGTVSTIKISEADAKKYYDQNLNKFKYPDKVRASHILISANPEEITQKLLSDPANKKLSKEEIKAKVDSELKVKLEKAQKILAEVKKNPQDFEKIAKENSDDTASAKQGGDLGFFSRQEMVEPFAKTAFAQKPNTISDIVQSPYGFHIILVKDRMKAGQQPYSKVKNDIIVYLENQEQLKVLDKMIESLKKQAKVEYVNPEYNPTSIKDALKKEEKYNPNVKEEMHPESQSATPAPLPAKK